MASKLVCRMAKVKKNDVKGYQIHNQRERESKTNPDINASLSHLNRDYINTQHISYMEKWKETFESQNESKRALRKDAVFFNEFVVGSDRDFFKDMSQSEKERFFEVSTDFFKERFGEQNVLYSVAHFDELKGAGAHAHIAIVPMKDGKLQSKNVFNRIELKAIQTLLPEHLKKHGFEIERGKEGSKAQHIDTATYKVLKSQEAVLMAEQQRETIQGETKLLEAKKEDLKELFDKVERIDSLEFEEQKNIFGKETGKIVIDQDDFERMKELAMMVVPEMEFKNKELQREVNILQSKIVEKDDKINSLEKKHDIGINILQKKYDTLFIQAKRYKEGLDDVVEELVTERLEEKVSELKEHHATQLAKQVEVKNEYLEEAEKLERKLGVVTRHVNTLKGESSWLEKERDELKVTNKGLVEENNSLKAELQKMFQHVKAMTERFDKLVEERVANWKDILRVSIHRATREWLVDKMPDNQNIVLDHTLDSKEINKRSEELIPELKAEREAMIQKRQKDRDMER